MLETAFGWALLSALFMLSAAALIWAVRAWVDERSARIASLADARSTREIGKDVKLNSMWFSEHPPTMWLMRQIGEHYSRTGSPRWCPGDMRQEWRKRMQEYVGQATKENP